MNRRPERAGLIYGLAAYGLWGVFPLYFRALDHVTPWELLAQRIAWSAVLLAILTTFIGAWKAIASHVFNRKTLRTLLITSMLIGVNWCLFMYAMSSRQIVEASLGYFIAPLVNTALGVIVLRERMRPLQLAALGLATVGVIALTIALGTLPWIALGLGFSFSVYGLLRKTVAAEALNGLTIESLALTPPSIAYLIWLESQGSAKFGHLDRVTDVMLIFAGAITVLPLFCFAKAARRLRMTTIGFLQFLAPSIQFLLAVTALGEPFESAKLAGFIPIWVALGIYVIDAVWNARRTRATQAPVPLPE